MKIGNYDIGSTEKCFIIAEAGVNHNGNLEIAHKLIEKAKEIGADAIKFQLFNTDELIVPSAQKAEYQKRTTESNQSQYQMLKNLELSNEDHLELMEHCKREKLIYICTPYDRKSLEFLKNADVPAIKIASTDVTNFPFLKKISISDTPVLLSTGMSTLSEIAEAYELLYQGLGSDKIAILHCTSEYPCPIDEVNLRVIKSLKETFQCIIGFSDHTSGTDIAPVAFGLGAIIIEKHFTLDKKLRGPDHQASLDPLEFLILIRKIRLIEQALGDGYKHLMECEKKNKKDMQKSIVASVDIPEGAIILENMITAKRPSTGLSPRWAEEIIGKKIKKTVKKDEQITFIHVL